MPIAGHAHREHRADVQRIQFVGAHIEKFGQRETAGTVVLVSDIGPVTAPIRESAKFQRVTEGSLVLTSLR